MKGSALKTAIIISALVLVVIVAALFLFGSSNLSVSDQVTPSASTTSTVIDMTVPTAPAAKTPVTTKTKTTTAPKSTSSTKTPTTRTYVAPAPSPTMSYNDYQIQLKNAQNQCNNAGVAQYHSLYDATLESSSYQSYYNEKTGACYLKATGKSHAAYAKDYVGHIYFRNVYQGSLLAECTDPTGLMTGFDKWSCTNKISGQSLNMAAFDALITSYVTK